MNYLSLSVFPGPVDEVDREHLHAQPPLDATHHHMETLTVSDHEAGVVQLISHLLEVKVGVLEKRERHDDQSHPRLNSITILAAQAPLNRDIHTSQRLSCSGEVNNFMWCGVGAERRISF